MLGGLSHVDAVLADAMRQIAMRQIAKRKIAMPHEPGGHVAQSPQKLVRKLGQKLATAQAAPPAVLRARRGPQGGQGGLLR